MMAGNFLVLNMTDIGQILSGPGTTRYAICNETNVTNPCVRQQHGPCKQRMYVTTKYGTVPLLQSLQSSARV